jgi:predicted O-linked N-acetylglucosamine transferase (SPINDLY family)
MPRQQAQHCGQKPHSRGPELPLLVTSPAQEGHAGRIARVFGWRSKKWQSQGRLAEDLIAAGNKAEDAGDLARACQLYREAVAAAPRFARAHLNLGIGLEAAGDVAGAIASYEAALAIDPANAAANYDFGRLLYTRGSFAQAEPLLKQALALQPDFPQARVMHGYVLQQLGRLEEALAELTLGLDGRPDDQAARAVLAETLVVQAAAHAQAGRHPAAIESYRRAVTAKPDHVTALSDLGTALLAVGRSAEAREFYGRAAALEPQSAAAHYNLALAQREAGEHEAAIASFRRAIALDRALAPAHYGLGHALRESARVDEALAALRQAFALKPDYAEARWSYVMAQLPAVYGVQDDPAACRRRFAAELANLEQWFAAEGTAQGPMAVGSHQPFAIAYDEEDNRPLLARYGALCSRVMADWQRRGGLPPPGERRHRPLRIGVVSSHFRSHSVWNAPAKGWFRELDNTRFALYAFDLGTGEDAETKFAKSHVVRYEAGPRSLQQWVHAIRACEPDALIYPEVGMHPMTARLAALRLAPLQAASWGHPETTGLPTIDYYLSAEAFEPPGAEAFYTERLVPLPQFGCLLERPNVVPEYPDLGRAGIDPELPLLVCPGMAFKYAPKHDWVFPEIARRLGRCRFIFFRHWNPALNERLAERLRAAFGARNLEVDRFVSFLPWQTPAQFHGWMRRADVYLDTIGFSGFNTALQAVECSLPIVTREGRFMRGRLASGILKRLGLAELVAPTEQAYVDLAVRLVEDGPYRERVARRMESASASLYGDVAPVRALEALLAG